MELSFIHNLIFGANLALAMTLATASLWSQRRTAAHFIFLALITLMAVASMMVLVWQVDFFEKNFVAIGFAVAPLVYLYVISLFHGDFTWKLSYGVHFLPFVVMSTLLYLVHIDWRVRISLSSVFIATYIVAAFLQVQTFREQAKSALSNVEKLRLDWIEVFLTLFTVLWFITNWCALDSFRNWKDVVFSSSICVVFGTFGFYFMRQSPILQVAWREIEESKHKTTKTKLEAHQLKELKENIRRALVEEKLFLNPNLRISDLAAAIDQPSYKVSQALNSGMKTNYYKFVNDLRIAHAKELLRSPRGRDIKLIDVAFESGFSSKSSFNSAFKAHTDMTPRDFRSFKV